MNLRLFGLSLFGLALLPLGGCLSTAPIIRQFVDDPFPVASVAPVADFPNLPVSDSDRPVLECESPEESSIIDNTPPEAPEEDFIFEPEEVHIFTEDEQVKLLSSDQWFRNAALINLLDTGRKLNSPPISSEERKRRDQLRRINMSKDELAKQSKQQYEVIDGLTSDWRWMHRGVEQLLAVPPGQRANPEVFLRQKYRDQKYKRLRSNAAILLGRDGNSNPSLGKFLLQLVQDEKTSLHVRCAGAEVLGRMSTITADDLIPLLEKVKERDIETKDRKTGESIQQRQAGNTDIWTELLIAIAEKIDPWEHDCFLEPLQASTSDIRLETAKIWRKKVLEKRPAEKLLPERFLEFARRESNPMVRVEIIKTLGACRVSGLFELLEHDLRHHTADVRNAAMLALADARCREAIPIVKDQLRDSNGITRAAAVSALCKLGALDEVFKLAGDQDSRVRVEVAKAFAERCTRQTAKMAKEYLSDRFANVQSATVEAIAGWSIEDSGTLLLEAAKSRDPGTRRRATEILAERGISSPHFNPEEQPKNQAAQHEELVQVFYETVGIEPDWDVGGKDIAASPAQAENQISRVFPTSPASSESRIHGGSGQESSAISEIRRCLDDWQDKTLPPNERQLIQRRLAKHGTELMPIIDYLMTVENRNIPSSLDKVFAESEPMFKEIEKLKSDDPLTKKNAAQELARLGAVSEPSKLAAKRIIDLVPMQTDAYVLILLLTSLKNADPELVCQLARPLLQSESVQVRRLSCEMLKQFGRSGDIPLLREALRDSSREVVRGALSAVDSILQEAEDADKSSVIEALKAILVNGDPGLQTDAAATLHRLGRAEGRDALRRLAASNDIRDKVYVIRTVSGLNDTGFVPMLIRFLDDKNGTISSEALKGLPKLAGEDIGREGGLTYASDVSATQQQIERWKAWAKEKRL